MYSHQNAHWAESNCQPIGVNQSYFSWEAWMNYLSLDEWKDYFYNLAVDAASNFVFCQILNGARIVDRQLGLSNVLAALVSTLGVNKGYSC